MSAKLGLNNLNNIYFSDNEIDKIYYGNNLVYKNTNVEKSFCIQNNYQGINTVKFQIMAGNPSISLQYRKEKKAWSNYTFNTNIELNTNEKVYFRGNNNRFNDNSNYVTIQSTEEFNVSGDIRSLFDKTMQRTDIPNDYCFYKLFEYSKVNNAVFLEFNSTITKPYCFYEMFANSNINIISSGGLKATIMTDHCYAKMFYNSKLRYATTIYGQNTADSCFYQMYAFCNIATAVSLYYMNNTHAEINCCREMYLGCTKLITPMGLSGFTSYSPFCFYGMYEGCKKLTKICALYATTYPTLCCSRMYYGCENLIVWDYYLGETKIWKIPMNSTAVSAESDFSQYMLFGTGTEGGQATTEETGAFTGSPQINTNYYVRNIVY